MFCCYRCGKEITGTPIHHRTMQRAFHIECYASENAEAERELFRSTSPTPVAPPSTIRMVDADPDDPDEQIDLEQIAREYREEEAAGRGEDFASNILEYDAEETAMEMEHERLIAEQECNYYRGLGLRNDR